MHRFKVWAPGKKSLEVLVDREILPMLPCSSQGWWSAETADSNNGSDYLFRIDGANAFPDPRSPWQPQGVHGPSRLYDHRAFPWTDGPFQVRPLSSALIYELHIGTFTPQGAFESAIEKLDHLISLGVTHVELMPVAEFAGSRGWGYDGVFPFAPHHLYGGPHGLKTLVNEAHAKGLAVILDVVYNHLGPTGNYLSQFAPYFTERFKTPWGSAINFDGPHSDEVRRYFIDNAKMWLRDYHFDGLRLDAIHAILDTSAYPFLEQLSTEIKQLEAHLGRHLVLIAESDLNDPRVVQSRERGGFGFHAQWSDDLHHALHSALTREQQGYYRDFVDASHLGAVYAQPFLYSGRFSPHRLRAHGRRICELEASSFIVCSQNHDQIGNRARGERLEHLVGIDKARLAAAFVLLSPYVPMLFQGEEWAASTPFQYFVDFAEEPELAKAVSEGRRREFRQFNWSPADVPDPQEPQTFARSKLEWQERDEGVHREMFAWYRELIALRRRIPALVDGRLDRISVSQDPNHGWLLVQRDDILVAFNFSDAAQHVSLTEGQGGQVLLMSKPGVQLSGDNLVLPPWSVAAVGRSSGPGG